MLEFIFWEQDMLCNLLFPKRLVVPGAFSSPSSTIMQGGHVLNTIFGTWVQALCESVHAVATVSSCVF